MSWLFLQPLPVWQLPLVYENCGTTLKQIPSMEMTASQFAKVDGVRLNFERSGPPMAGKPTLVLIHGFGASLQSWHDVYPILSRDIPVVRVDLKGFGFSDKPNDGRYDPTVHAKLLAKFLNNLPDQELVLIGHSYGGGIILLTQLFLREESAQARVRAMVLIDAAVYPQGYPFFVAHIRNPTTRFLTEIFTSPTWRSRYVLERVFANKVAISPERVYRYAYFLTLPGSERALKDVAEQIDSTHSVNLVRRLPEIDVPVLILWGAKDPVISVENGRHLLRDLPRARLEILQGAGHVPHEEFPQDTATLILNFVDQLYQ